METPAESSEGSDELMPYFKVIKYNEGEGQQARESISHDQFLQPKPGFIEKLERQKQKYTLHMSVQRNPEDDESGEASGVERPSNIE